MNSVIVLMIAMLFAMISSNTTTHTDTDNGNNTIEQGDLTNDLMNQIMAMDSNNISADAILKMIAAYGDNINQSANQDGVVSDLMNQIMAMDSNNISADAISKMITDMGKSTIESISDADSKQFAVNLLNEATNYPETFADNLKATSENLLYAYPNPASGDVTIEFYHNWQLHFEKIRVKGAKLDLYYDDTKVTALEFDNILDNKVVIPKRYLKEKGTYTVIMVKDPAFKTSFVVSK